MYNLCMRLHVPPQNALYMPSNAFLTMFCVCCVCCVLHRLIACPASGHRMGGVVMMEHDVVKDVARGLSWLKHIICADICNTHTYTMFLDWRGWGLKQMEGNRRVRY